MARTDDLGFSSVLLGKGERPETRWDVLFFTLDPTRLGGEISLIFGLLDDHTMPMETPITTCNVRRLALTVASIRKILADPTITVESQSKFGEMNSWFDFIRCSNTNYDCFYRREQDNVVKTSHKIPFIHNRAKQVLVTKFTKFNFRKYFLQKKNSNTKVDSRALVSVNGNGLPLLPLSSSATSNTHKGILNMHNYYYT